MERGPRLVAAVLGVWKAGGAVVPLDPEHPAARLAHALSDSGTHLLLTGESLRARLPEFEAEIVALDSTPLPPAPSPARGEGENDGVEDRAAVAGCSLFPVTLHAARAPDEPCSLAYVIYTSGSTGTPKGVLVQHGSLAGTLLAASDALGFGAGEVFASLASHAFDIWLLETFAPLLSGGAVRVVPREVVLDAARLVGELADADALHAVPALLREVVRGVKAGPGTLPRARRVYVGGDAVPPELVDEARRAFPSARVRVLYGPTEASIICASAAAGADAPLPGRMLGLPLPGATLHVCDEAGEPVPLGVPGEVRVGGGGVARGYGGRAGLTAAAFVPDPFSGVPGARLYRTGDRARRLPDGRLEFLGRVDRQVKVRGFRVEPGEVEAALRAQPGVRDAAVLARPDAEGGVRLAAYVVAEPGSAPAADGALRAALRAVLPEHMVPGAIVALDALPLTPTGKVDVAALPGPAAPAVEYAAPRSAVEEVLARDWAEVLGLETVGIHDDFFALGGHSLLAARLVTRLRVLRVEVPVRSVFEAPTVARLAEHVVRAGAKPGAVEAVAAVLLRVRGMSAGEKQAALRDRQAGPAT
jgi:amino acid adenylation domain-containing protein